VTEEPENLRLVRTLADGTKKSTPLRVRYGGRRHGLDRWLVEVEPGDLDGDVVILADRLPPGAEVGIFVRDT
jgi:hypothetical protein